MSTLILPVAGKSSRFPNMRPKWLLTMPSGRLMYEESVQGLPIDKFDRVILTCLKEHVEKFVSYERLVNSAKKNVSSNIEFCVLENPTSSHSETVYETLVRMNVEGEFYLKDCDNRFDIDFISEANSIAVVSLNDMDLIDAKNKSYVLQDENKYVKTIVEKSVISSDFCCGGYSFASSAIFKSSFENLRKLSAHGSAEEIYVSHVIFHMLLNGEEFRTHIASNYQDWGTLREYRHACRQAFTVFCDLDGVLFENASKFGKNGWKSKVISRNIKALAELQKAGKIYLVVTTSRPESESSYVKSSLEKEGLQYDQAIWGLPHTKRVLVNDFSSTNPYPTSIAINLERDSESLSEYLHQLVI